MQPRLVGKVSQRLRALIKGDEWGAAREVDIATLGLIERVRDEWQSRQHSRDEQPFGLPQLLRSLHGRESAAARVKSHRNAERRPLQLPQHRRGRDGQSQPLDEAFFARRRYTVEELTDFADALFVEIAYRCVLKRQPDPVGFSGFLRPLREGIRDRIEILHALTASTEGRSQNVRIVGLRRVAFWRLAERVRIIGPVVAWLHGLATVGRFAQRLQVIEARSEAGYQEHAAWLQSLVDSDIAGINDSIHTLEKSQVQVETAVLGLANRYRRFLLEAQLHDVVGAADAPDAPGDADGGTVERATDRLARLENSLRDHQARLDTIASDIQRRRATAP